MRKTELDNFVQVKLALADKYRRKSRASSSKQQTRLFARQADRYQLQAEKAARAVT